MKNNFQFLDEFIYQNQQKISESFYFQTEICGQLCVQKNTLSLSNVQQAFFLFTPTRIGTCVCLLTPQYNNTTTLFLSLSLSLSHTHTHYCQSKLACFPTNFFSYSFMILQLSVCLLTYLPSAKSCLPTLVKHFKSTK